MLLYKSWMETRLRFYVGALFITVLCLFFVLGHPWIINQWEMDKKVHPEWADPWWLPMAKADYAYFLWHFLYNYLLQFVWVLFTVLLALGSLKSEVEKGSILFTLSLPISRKQIFFQRNLVGFSEAIILAFIPVGLLPLSSMIIGQNYPIFLAVQHALLFSIGGLVFFSFGLLLNSLIGNESVTFLLAIGIVIIFYFLFQPYAEDEFTKPEWIKWIDVPGMMAGSKNGHYLDYYPIAKIFQCLGLATLFTGISYYIIHKRNF